MQPIELYFIRHGIAVDRSESLPDGDRSLTDEGKKKTEKIAKRLHQMGLHFDLILTSPLVRAQQTANLLQAAKLAPQLAENPQLAPEGSLKLWLEWLTEWQQTGGKRLALVGHQPNLGEWVQTLVWGEPKGAIEVKKAGIVGVSLPLSGSPIGRSTLFWLTPPKYLLL